MTASKLKNHGQTAAKYAGAFLAKWVARGIGLLLVLFGILGMLTPIPFGAIFFVFGLFFLIPTTPMAADAVRWVRRRVGLFDRVMAAITKKLPVPYRRILRETEVDQKGL